MFELWEFNASLSYSSAVNVRSIHITLIIFKNRDFLLDIDFSNQRFLKRSFQHFLHHFFPLHLALVSIKFWPCAKMVCNWEETVTVLNNKEELEENLWPSEECFFFSASCCCKCRCFCHAMECWSSVLD